MCDVVCYEASRSVYVRIYINWTAPAWLLQNKYSPPCMAHHQFSLFSLCSVFISFLLIRRSLKCETRPFVTCLQYRLYNDRWQVYLTTQSLTWLCVTHEGVAVRLDRAETVVTHVVVLTNFAFVARACDWVHVARITPGKHRWENRWEVRTSTSPQTSWNNIHLLTERKKSMQSERTGEKNVPLLHPIHDGIIFIF